MNLISTNTQIQESRGQGFLTFTNIFKIQNSNVIKAPISIKMRTISLEVTNRMTENSAEKPSTTYFQKRTTTFAFLISTHKTKRYRITSTELTNNQRNSFNIHKQQETFFCHDKHNNNLSHPAIIFQNFNSNPSAEIHCDGVTGLVFSKPPYMTMKY